VPQGTPSFLINFIVLIELTRTLIRPITLCVRLTANIVAGHLLITLLNNFLIQRNLTVLFRLGLAPFILTVLESAVAFIQAYVFVTLITLYAASIVQSCGPERCRQLIEEGMQASGRKFEHRRHHCKRKCEGWDHEKCKHGVGAAGHMLRCLQEGGGDGGGGGGDDGGGGGGDGGGGGGGGGGWDRRRGGDRDRHRRERERRERERRHRHERERRERERRERERRNRGRGRGR